jgi:hypothetical protein
LQASTVQATPSEQSTVVPGWQSSTESQVSTPLQKAPSSQRVSSAVCTHWSAASSQVSTVQATPSEQSTDVPGWQSSAGSQVSTPLQKAPSLQSASLGVWTHWSAASSQVSTVQVIPSEQSKAAGWQSSAGSQISAPLQKAPSSQLAGSGVWTHWSAASSQASTVQATPSAQSMGAPA